MDTIKMFAMTGETARGGGEITVHAFLSKQT
jgi:hypothetical protein